MVRNGDPLMCKSQNELTRMKLKFLRMAHAIVDFQLTALVEAVTCHG